MKIIQWVGSLFNLNSDKISTIKSVERLKTCVQCEFYNNKTDICGVKKTYMPHNIIWKDSECPKNKW